MPRITWSLSARSYAESTPANPTMSGTYWKPICRSEGWRRGWGEAHDPGNPRCRTSPQLYWLHLHFGHFVGPNISKTMNRNYSHSKRIAYHIWSHIIISQYFTHAQLLNAWWFTEVFPLPQWIAPLLVTKVLQHNCNNFSDEAPGSGHRWPTFWTEIILRRKPWASPRLQGGKAKKKSNILLKSKIVVNDGECFFPSTFFFAVRDFRLHARHQYTWVTLYIGVVM